MAAVASSNPALLTVSAVLLLLVLVRVGSLAILSHVNPKEASMDTTRNSLKLFSSALLETLWTAGASGYLSLAEVGLV
jgi:hypothetical protein